MTSLITGIQTWHSIKITRNLACINWDKVKTESSRARTCKRSSKVWLRSTDREFASGIKMQFLEMNMSVVGYP